MARPRTAGEVQELVSAARRERRPVLARSGGWHLGLGELRGDAVALDLSAFTGIEAKGDTAWLGTGLSSRAAAGLLGDRGFPVGHAPEVGIGGFLLSGGNGWNGECWFAACDRVLAVEMVTPDGELRTVDDDSDPSLMALVRGAGPLVPGVVLQFRVALPAPTRIARQSLILPASAAGELGAALDRIAAPPGLELTVFLRPGAEEPVLTVSATAFDAGDPRALLEPLAELAAAASRVTTADFATLGEVMDTLSTGPVPPAAFHQGWTRAGHAATLPLLVESLRVAPQVASVLVAQAPARPEPGRPSVYSIPGPVSVAAYAHTPGAAGRGWARATIDALPTCGHFVGEADLGHVPVLSCFSTADRLRLPQLIAATDPEGWFSPLPLGTG